MIVDRGQTVDLGQTACLHVDTAYAPARRYAPLWSRLARTWRSAGR